MRLDYPMFANGMYCFKNDDFDDEETEEKKRKETPVLRVVKDIVNKTKSNSKISQIPEEDMEDVDSDELLPSTVDFAKKAEVIAVVSRIRLA